MNSQETNKSLCLQLRTSEESPFCGPCHHLLSLVLLLDGTHSRVSRYLLVSSSPYWFCGSNSTYFYNKHFTN
ncbi:hypothetical protein LEMLEM_LOCUS22386 [Lemmus lemmus]